MALGAYVVPKCTIDDTKKYSKGEGANGLQEDFAKAVEDFVNQSKEDGVTVKLGIHGWVSVDGIHRMSRDGRTDVKELHEYYRYGLAWEIESIECKDQDKYKEWLKDSGAKAGLEIKVTAAIDANSTRENSKSMSKICVIVPKNFKVDDSADDVTYDATVVDMDSDGDSSLSANGTTSDASFAEGAYFFSNMFKSIQDEGVSEILRGDRALANDVPLWGSVRDAINASMRSCMSAPDGSFIAWYPDYWGFVDDTPALILEDIELIDLTISHSDSHFYSHVYTPGVYAADGSSPSGGMEYMLTQGVVSIESSMATATSETLANKEGVTEASSTPSALIANLIHIPKGEEWKYSPKELYRRYGARPWTNGKTQLAGTAKLVEDFSGNTMEGGVASNPKYIMPFLAALYEFMYQWSQQYQARLSMTFQPGLFPGVRIRVKSLDISFYVESVTHNMNYSTGFTTDATCTCPIGTLLPGMVNPKR